MIAFVSILSVDAQRADSNRVDCVPCLTLSEYKPFGQSEALLVPKGKEIVHFCALMSFC
jgi:hypothetical protein